MPYALPRVLRGAPDFHPKVGLDDTEEFPYYKGFRRPARVNHSA